MPIDPEKARREHIRWLVLLCLYYAQPVGANEGLIASTVVSEVPDVTGREIRLHLDYLEERKLLHVDGRHQANWFAKLGRYGIDVVEYSVECDPGIARPPKF